MGGKRSVVAAAWLLVIGTWITTGMTAEAASLSSYPNCKALNVKYRHGVGRAGAHDHVRGSTRPVTNFYVNTALYNANMARDGDHDGIACERH